MLRWDSGRKSSGRVAGKGWLHDLGVNRLWEEQEEQEEFVDMGMGATVNLGRVVEGRARALSAERRTGKSALRTNVTCHLLR